MAVSWRTLWRRATDPRSSAVAASAFVSLAAAAVAAAQDRALVHDSASPDSIRFDQSPLPGGAAAVFRFLFSGVPQWIQIGGVVVGAIVGVWLAIVAWKRRAEIATWLLTRSRGAKIALGASTVLGLGIAGGVGAWSWDYMMHDNDFCSSCHVMKGAFTRFRVSEHDRLECHACHQQSIFASAKELYYWVMDRPEKIPAHAPVPNRICGECHEQSQADSTWKRVIATAGHAVHFKSDSSSLKDLMCVDCHAKEVHAFKAVDVSCKSSGCHEETKVVLGSMADQSGLHCVTCHDFGKSVSEKVAIDSTRQALVPARQECFTCHEMRQKLAERDLDKDPHQATCGTCHNPHDQTKAGKAFDSCATAGCHASADTLTAFHRGLGNHALDQCGQCHKPHSWKVESTRCIDCHGDIYQRKPVPFKRAETESSAASLAPESLDRRVRGGPHADVVEPPVEERAVLAPRAAADTLFDHARHKSVACTACHSSDRTHGAVTIRSVTECQACHHAKDGKAGICEACHAASELTATRTIPTRLRITRRDQPIERSLAFEHTQHVSRACADCHEDGVAKRVRTTCAECHTDHHRPAANCASCHGDAKGTHDRASHVSCASCHEGAGTAALPPSRMVCLACHPAQRDHKPTGDCGECHRTTWQPRRAG